MANQWQSRDQSPRNASQPAILLIITMHRNLLTLSESTCKPANILRVKFEFGL